MSDSAKSVRVRTSRILRPAIGAVILNSVCGGIALADQFPNVRYGWTHTVEGSEIRIDSFAVDSSGDIVLFGAYNGQYDFDPTEGVDVQPASGPGAGIFVSRYGQDGSYRWTRVWEWNSRASSSFDCALDSDGSVLMTGGFAGRLDFDPGSGEDWHDAGVGSDIYVIKMESDGDFAWARTIGGEETVLGFAIAVGASGDVVITAKFGGVIDFDPTAGVDLHKSVGFRDAFVTLLRGDGSYGWTYTFGGTSVTTGHDIAVDASGNMLVIGTFSGEVDFDPTPGVDIQASGGSSDVFLWRLNADETYGWTRTVGGSDQESARALTFDRDGNIAFVGRFESSDADFDPGPGVDLHVSRGQWDVFVSKYTADGIYLWTRSMGAEGSDGIGGVAADSFGNVYYAGSVTDFGSPIDLDPTDGVDAWTPHETDIFITKLGPDGSYFWSSVFGGPRAEGAASIHAADDDSVIYSGGFSGRRSLVDLDPTRFVDLRSGSDMFITKLLPGAIGDLNCDGRVNSLDVEPFILALFDPDEYRRTHADCEIDLADTNRDARVDAFDIVWFLDILFR